MRVDRQNNALLNSLSSKVSALKSVTVDIHDNARDHDTLDHSVCLIPLTYLRLDNIHISLSLSLSYIFNEDG